MGANAPSNLYPALLQRGLFGFMLVNIQGLPVVYRTVRVLVVQARAPVRRRRMISGFYRVYPNSMYE